MVWERGSGSGGDWSGGQVIHGRGGGRSRSGGSW